MSKIMVINSGSSTIKFKIFNNSCGTAIVKGVVDRIGLMESFIEIRDDSRQVSELVDIPNHKVGIEILLELLLKNDFLNDLEEVDKIGHRIVQGGERFKSATIVGAEELEEIKSLSALAPLHNAANALAIEVFQEILPTALNIAVFDTEFHQTMPSESYRYAVPEEWYTNYGVRRYGMHGTSHKYVANKVSQIKNMKLEDMKIISCHLGNGASVAAIDGGQVIQTSMGLTPLEGLVMGSRSGDIDPAIYSYICEELDYSVSDITEILNKESGMLALSGISSDFRDINAAYLKGDARAELALNVYIARLVEYIGAYYFRLKGADAIILTGGVGENNRLIREKLMERLKFLGIGFNEEANENNEVLISEENSSIDVMVIPTDEEYQIFLETKVFK